MSLKNSDKNTKTNCELIQATSALLLDAGNGTDGSIRATVSIKRALIAKQIYEFFNSVHDFSKLINTSSVCGFNKE